MMALQSPMLPSPNNNLMSAFSPYTDSPSSPRPFRSPVISSMPSDQSSFLHPPNPLSPLASSPSDIADPSPIAPSSNGTDTTDIDDSGIATEEPIVQTQGTPRLWESELKLDTKNTAPSFKPNSDEDEQPNSVIHAPQGFESFHARRSPPSIRRSTPTPSQRPDIKTDSSQLQSDARGEKSPPHLSINNRSLQPSKAFSTSPVSPPPISTSVPRSKDWSETPRAQTRSEAEADGELSEHGRSKNSTRSTSLEDIPEAQDTDQADDQTRSYQTSSFDQTVGNLQEMGDEVAALRLALSECWTLCNTLAGLSYIHRERIFSFGGKGDIQQHVWKSCWKLCQKLYETRDEDFATQVRPTLDLCREFCQSLFDVRKRENETADSVLRVSFELNNHLYNTHDRTLPEAFRERTLDFYITLCHRLMKQRRRLAEETDSLLNACWSLAEMLFSLRQNKREGKSADEELLGSAVQACWDLCDLFREGWTQVRPDRGTPRPSQTTFTQAFQQVKQSEMAAAAEAEAEAEESDDDKFGRMNPETPTTVFEDTQTASPDEPPVPNILVLGPDYSNSRQQWSSSSSNLSDYSQSTTSSTSTIINPADDPYLVCLKLLIVKAAMNSGYQRGTSMNLASYVKSIPSNSFGNAPWQIYLLENYKKLVASDPGFRSPGPSRRATAADVGRAVQWMVESGQYTWLKDLFRLVFGFHVEDGAVRRDVTIQS